ncbi:MAG TPA: hypothetical protein VHG28_03250 [Longimicrobiaceae bacterium]|nr:hypothetical protein [Longimicrobiaceae bacterium]
MISGRARRVLVYTASLLLAPLPVMPFAWGTREFSLAAVAWGAILIVSSLYMARGEMGRRDLLGTKLLAASFGTLVLGVLLAVGSIVHLARI